MLNFIKDSYSLTISMESSGIEVIIKIGYTGHDDPISAFNKKKIMYP